jgi:hypothetical protein
MKSIDKFIYDIITEASLDTRIPSGIIDLKNVDHIQVVAEIMYDSCQNEDVVNEFLNKFLSEGKHPDRQAFNKEGWLVTFPSKEYRDAALKKGTHSISDPTHGKGGMNLYYKKKGKQKRQTQQATTAVQSPTQPPQKAGQPTTTQQPAPPDSPTGTAQQSTSPTKLAGAQATPVTPDQTTPSEPATAAPVATTPTEKTPQASEPDTYSAPKPSDAPAVDVPVVTTPPEQYASVSKKFAANKGWSEAPYGEYRDREGNTVAVVGLSGEVVPTKSVDRDEYKLFAEKNKP